MNTTTNEQVVLTDSRTAPIHPETLRLAANLAEMIGHVVHYKCPMGYGPVDMTLTEVRLYDTGIKIRGIQDAARPTEFYHAHLCDKCKVSVVLELGTVDA